MNRIRRAEEGFCDRRVTLTDSIIHCAENDQASKSIILYIYIFILLQT